MKKANAVLNGASLLLAALFLSASAQADPAAQARFHDEQARKSYDAGNYEAALREFFLEQRTAPNSRISFNIALCFEDMKRDDDAFMFFQEYLASDDSDAERRTYAETASKKLEAKTARVLVTSDPPGADIYVDKQEYGSYGKTPRLLAVSEGTHKLWVELGGRKPATASISAKKGEQSTANLAPVLIVGSLQITSSVAGDATVRTPAGVVVAKGKTPLTSQLPPGEYTVAIEAHGYLPFSGVGAVTADGSSSVDAALTLAPSSTGDVTITSNIPGALIELDGHAIGLSPTVLPSIPVGSHRLRMRAPAILPWEGPVDVRSEERSWVTVSLEKPPQVHRSSATWLAGGLGVAALLGSAVVGVMATSAHSDFDKAGLDSDRSSLRDRGVTLNAVSDTLLVTGVVASAAAVVLYLTTGETMGRPSSASFTSSKR